MECISFANWCVSNIRRLAMAKTVAAVKKAKAKATPKTTSTRKRNGEAVNPFDSVPDHNQTSIVSFSKKPKTELPQSAVNPDTAVPSSESPTAGTFHTIPRGSAINFNELVRVAGGLCSSDSLGWKIRLHSFVESLDSQEFLALISQCKSHSRFQAFENHTKPLTEADWKFGDEEGSDPLEDVLDMIHWLVLEDTNVDEIEQEKPSDQSRSKSSEVDEQPAIAEGVETVSWLNN